MIYSVLPSFILGFHGCDQSVAGQVLSLRKQLQPSQNKYDWLGSGIYFWENSPERAWDWARLQQDRGKVKSPAVIGAIIDLGRCLNLLDRQFLKIVKVAYQDTLDVARDARKPLPKNKPLKSSRDLLLRNLDCAVIEMVHEARRQIGVPPFDSVRAAFIEGKPLYRNSGFREHNHIQICVRNPGCIKGYFLPIPDHPEASLE